MVIYGSSVLCDIFWGVHIEFIALHPVRLLSENSFDEAKQLLLPYPSYRSFYPILRNVHSGGCIRVERVPSNPAVVTPIIPTRIPITQIKGLKV